MNPVSAGDYQLIYDPSLGEAEPWYINDHTFIRDRLGAWHLFGITHAEPAMPLDEIHLAHATAPALLGPWTKQPFALTADRALGESHLWAPHVIDHDGRYWMFVCAGGSHGSAYQIILATSDDLWTWTRHPANPMVIDGWDARDPMILRHDDRWLLYYTATSSPTGGNHVVKVAESDDLTTWSEPVVAYVDPMQGTFGGPTESPFVVNRRGRWYLFIGPDAAAVADGLERGEYDRAAYCRTKVLWSDTPRSFQPDRVAGTVGSHAAEVIVDEDGAWWVSHCGWGERGVHLAPLIWDDE